MDLNDRVALVTGATRGIGAAIARRLAEAGADVALGYGADRESAEKVVSELEDSASKCAVVVVGDLADPEHALEMARTTGDSDVLCYIPSGLIGWDPRFLRMSLHWVGRRLRTTR